MGKAKFSATAQMQKIDIDENKAAEMKRVWLETFPEMAEYLKPSIDNVTTVRNILKLLRQANIFVDTSRDFATMQDILAYLQSSGTVIPDDLYKEIKDSVVYEVYTVSGRIKRNCSYCAACNYAFQSLAADGAKIMLWNVTRAGYKIVNFIH